jgi:hypothetical protein
LKTPPREFQAIVFLVGCTVVHDCMSVVAAALFVLLLPCFLHHHGEKVLGQALNLPDDMPAVYAKYFHSGSLQMQHFNRSTKSSSSLAPWMQQQPMEKTTPTQRKEIKQARVLKTYLKEKVSMINESNGILNSWNP